MFWDEAIIYIKAGKGGDGLVSFHRERYTRWGGPDGGDGGDGGDIYLVAVREKNTLADYVRLKKFFAEDGKRGGRNKKKGKSGKDLILKVPVGTVVYQGEDKNTKEIKEWKKIVDLVTPGQQIRVARGGRGGFGNAHFVSAIRQIPNKALPGQPGEEKFLKLELKLIADVGLIGRPNCGKSTLLSIISAARPKIADYPFTTTVPNLGVVKIDNKSFVVADIPGLIEGASKGKGLGDKFLRHIERTKILVHLLDATRNDLVADYKEVRKELALFSKEILKKPELIVINKIDAVSEEELGEKNKLFQLKTHRKPFFISAVTKKGVKELLYKIGQVLQQTAE